MPKLLKIGASQSRTLSTLSETLSALEVIAHSASAQGISVLLFPECYLGGYPRECDFGCAVGARSTRGREQFLQHFKSAVDLGDTPSGAGARWIDRSLPVAHDAKFRGDGTRETLERIAAETGILIVTGLVERAGGSLFCGVVYVDPERGTLGKRRKVMPTGSERTIWARGDVSTLQAVTTTIKGVKLTLAAAICWENIMPLVRQTLYAQNVNLYLAPTADFKPTWLPLVQTIGLESRAFVLSANMCQRRKNLPSWITSPPPGRDAQPSTTPVLSGRRRSSVVKRTEDDHEITWPVSSQPASSSSSGPRPPLSKTKSHSTVLPTSSSEHEIAFPFHQQQQKNPTLGLTGEEFVSRGGSCIIGPMGQVLAPPLWDVEEGGLLTVEVDFEDCERCRLDSDLAASYAVPEAFTLEVKGLRLEPPP
ncbi:MAG: hypothetical protein M1814_001749 [Vezdaea aestivalis]|nr:MAG: hypothetical protein M1814_001749 [Vezdaea aestivalis]